MFSAFVPGRRRLALLSPIRCHSDVTTRGRVLDQTSFRLRRARFDDV